MQAKIHGQQYYDVAQAAEFSGYTEEHVRRLARQGKIDSTKHGLMVFVSVDSLTRYTNEMKALGSTKYSPWRD